MGGFIASASTAKNGYVSCIVPTLRRERGHHREERGRLRGHRVRGGQAAGADGRQRALNLIEVARPISATGCSTRRSR